MNFHIVLRRQSGGGFVVRCLELSSCISEGKTEEEALKNIEDAIRLYLKDVERKSKMKKAKVVSITI